MRTLAGESAGPMERRRPRRPAPHPPSPRQSPADRAAVPTHRGPRGPRTTPACGGGRRGRRRSMGRWPVRTPALQDWRALTDGASAPCSAGTMERRRPRRPAPHPRPLTQSRADRAAVPMHRGAGGPRTMPACGVGRRGRRRSMGRWPVRTPALQELPPPDGWSAGTMERRRPRRPAPHPRPLRQSRTDRAAVPRTLAGEDTGAPSRSGARLVGRGSPGSGSGGVWWCGAVSLLA